MSRSSSGISESTDSLPSTSSSSATEVLTKELMYANVNDSRIVAAKIASLDPECHVNPSSVTSNSATSHPQLQSTVTSSSAASISSIIPPSSASNNSFPNPFTGVSTYKDVCRVASTITTIRDATDDTHAGVYITAFTLRRSGQDLINDVAQADAMSKVARAGWKSSDMDEWTKESIVRYFVLFEHVMKKVVEFGGTRIAYFGCAKNFSLRYLPTTFRGNNALHHFLRDLAASHPQLFRFEYRIIHICPAEGKFAIERQLGEYAGMDEEWAVLPWTGEKLMMNQMMLGIITGGWQASHRSRGHNIWSDFVTGSPAEYAEAVKFYKYLHSNYIYSVDTMMEKLRQLSGMALPFETDQEYEHSRSSVRGFVRTHLCREVLKEDPSFRTYNEGVAKAMRYRVIFRKYFEIMLRTVPYWVPSTAGRWTNTCKAAWNEHKLPEEDYTLFHTWLLPSESPMCARELIHLLWEEHIKYQKSHPDIPKPKVDYWRQLFAGKSAAERKKEKRKQKKKEAEMDIDEEEEKTPTPSSAATVTAASHSSPIKQAVAVVGNVFKTLRQTAVSSFFSRPPQMPSAPTSITPSLLGPLRIEDEAKRLDSGEPSPKSRRRM